MRAWWGLPALAATVLVSAGCGAVGTVGASADTTRGESLFKEKCGGCHTLAAAGTKGTVGPNLDEAFAYARQQEFEQSTIEDVVRGQIAYAVAPMPQNLVTGSDADAVAAYVASVAGKPGAAAGAKLTSTDGKTIFTAKCGSCHTLANAGTSGQVGPNLDDLKPAQARVQRQVTNGGAQMPSFKGDLTPAQIAAVAKYVSSVAGK